MDSSSSEAMDLLNDELDVNWGSFKTLLQLMKQMNAEKKKTQVSSVATGISSVFETPTIGVAPLKLNNPFLEIAPSELSLLSFNIKSILPMLTRLPKLLPTFGLFKRDHPALFLPKLEVYFLIHNIARYEWLAYAKLSLTGSALEWRELHSKNWKTYEDFQESFLKTYWSQEKQSAVRQRLVQHKYSAGSSTHLADFFRKQINLYCLFTPPLEESVMQQEIMNRFPPQIQYRWHSLKNPTLMDTVNFLEAEDEIARMPVVRIDQNGNKIMSEKSARKCPYSSSKSNHRVQRCSRPLLPPTRPLLPPTQHSQPTSQPDLTTLLSKTDSFWFKVLADSMAKLNL